MLIARQNGHIDQAPWKKKPAGPVKREREGCTEKAAGPGPTAA